jgi:hypothetical protein
MLRRLVFAFANINRSIPKRAGQLLDSIQRNVIQLQDMPGREFERPIFVVDVISNDTGDNVELANTIFDFAAR